MVTRDGEFISVHPIIHSWSRDRQGEGRLPGLTTSVVLALVKFITKDPLWDPHIRACSRLALEYVVPSLSEDTIQDVWIALRRLANFERGSLRLGLCWSAFEIGLQETEACQLRCENLVLACFEDIPASPDLDALRLSLAGAPSLAHVSKPLPHDHWIYGSKSELFRAGQGLLWELFEQSPKYSAQWGQLRDGYCQEVDSGADEERAKTTRLLLAILLENKGTLGQAPPRYREQLLASRSFNSFTSRFWATSRWALGQVMGSYSWASGW